MVFKLFALLIHSYQVNIGYECYQKVTMKLRY